MAEKTRRLPCNLEELATRLIGRYAQGLLTLETLAARLSEAEYATALLSSEHLQGMQDKRTLETLVRGICSQAVYEGCLASEGDIRDQAFDNLGRFLSDMLGYSTVRADLRARGQDSEVVQQTLLEVWRTLHNQKAGPERPSAFLGWSRVILRRQLARYLARSKGTACVSLDEQQELVDEELSERAEGDPLEAVMREETGAELKAAILTLKNRQYQQVLLGIFFVGLEERELAARWHVRVQDIYLWRCRALKALRKNEIFARIS